LNTDSCFALPQAGVKPDTHTHTHSLSLSRCRTQFQHFQSLVPHRPTYLSRGRSCLACRIASATEEEAVVLSWALLTFYSLDSESEVNLNLVRGKRRWRYYARLDHIWPSAECSTHTCSTVDPQLDRAKGQFSQHGRQCHTNNNIRGPKMDRTCCNTRQWRERVAS
jgi:hypothetical protein